MSIGDAYNNAYGIQQSWLAGNMSRFEIVEEFLQNLFEESDQISSASTYYNDDVNEQQCNGTSHTRIEDFLPKLNILVTSRGNGVEIVQPRTRTELVDALKQTTWIPFVTGEGAEVGCRMYEDFERMLLTEGKTEWNILHPEGCSFYCRKDGFDRDEILEIMRKAILT